MCDPPGRGVNREVVAEFPRAQLLSCPVQEPGTWKPAREEVEAGGAGALQTAGSCYCCSRETDGCTAPELAARDTSPPQLVKPDGGRLRDASPSLESAEAQCLYSIVSKDAESKPQSAKSKETPGQWKIKLENTRENTQGLKYC